MHKPYNVRHWGAGLAPGRLSQAHWGCLDPREACELPPNKAAWSVKWLPGHQDLADPRTVGARQMPFAAVLGGEQKTSGSRVTEIYFLR